MSQFRLSRRDVVGRGEPDTERADGAGTPFCDAKEMDKCLCRWWSISPEKSADPPSVGEQTTRAPQTSRELRLYHQHTCRSAAYSGRPDDALSLSLERCEHRPFHPCIQQGRPASSAFFCTSRQNRAMRRSSSACLHTSCCRCFLFLVLAHDGQILHGSERSRMNSFVNMQNRFHKYDPLQATPTSRRTLPKGRYGKDSAGQEPNISQSSTRLRCRYATDTGSQTSPTILWPGCSRRRRNADLTGISGPHHDTSADPLTRWAKPSRRRPSGNNAQPRCPGCNRAGREHFLPQSHPGHPAFFVFLERRMKPPCSICG